MKNMTRCIRAMLCLALCLFTLATASAAVIDPAATGSLTINAADGGKAIPGVAFEIYRVATLNDEAQLEMLPGWTSSEADLLHISDWTAFTANVMTERLDHTVDATATTDQNGKAAFADVASGLYLAVADPVTFDKNVYTFAAFVVSVPSKKNGEYIYDVQAVAKYFTTEDEVKKLEVRKIWKDVGYEEKRPDHITVDLYRGSKLFKSAELNRENNWMYTFTGLSVKETWTVKERKPAGYTMSTKLDGDVVFITNEIVPPTPTPVVTTPAPTSTPTSKPKPTPTPIPKTGLTWWPVPLLAGLGFVMFLLGFVAHRKWRDEHEES